MPKDLLKQRLVEYGMDLGFYLVGVTDATPTQSNNLRADMEHDPKAIMPRARSIVVAAWPYTPHVMNFPKNIARYSAHYIEYPKGREAIKKLGDFLEKVGYKAIIQPNLPVKEIAYRAGMGYYGKNGLIHTKGFGSWISLHWLLTDALLSPDKGMADITDCGDCNLCIKACPTGAIGLDGQVAPGKCIRNYMLSSDFIPIDIRDKMGSMMLGCDICQIVCPFNRAGVLKARLPDYNEMELFDLANILNEATSGLKGRMDKMGEIIGKNYARARKILSTAIILAGNSGDQTYIPALIKLLGHPHPPIRGHCAWALGKIGLEGGKGVLEDALKVEKDPGVIKEIHGALH